MPPRTSTDDPPPPAPGPRFAFVKHWSDAAFVRQAAEQGVRPEPALRERLRDAVNFLTRARLKEAQRGVDVRLPGVDVRVELYASPLNTDGWVEATVCDELVAQGHGCKADRCYAFDATYVYVRDWDVTEVPSGHFRASASYTVEGNKVTVHATADPCTSVAWRFTGVHGSPG
jgi:hypothetical protein